MTVVHAQSGATQAYWYFYVVRCCDHSLYAGVTTDLNRRLAEHNAGTASKYTRVKRPVRLIHFERFRTRSAALRRESAFKKLPKQQKEVLILGERGALLKSWEEIGIKKPD